MKKWLTIIFCAFCVQGFSQTMTLYTKNVLKKNREKFYRNVVHNIILKNLSDSNSVENEDAWANAFDAIALVQYQTAFTQQKIEQAVASFPNHGSGFQQSLLDLLNGLYPGKYIGAIKKFLPAIEHDKTFAMAANYILSSGNEDDAVYIEFITQERMSLDKENPYYQQLYYRASLFNKNISAPSLSGFFQKNYLPGNVLLISIQRKNRNFPGLLLVRDAAGNFVKDSNGGYFHVPQLARSISNMPGYISNGNTPEGIFRMDGFEVSNNAFIGPSVNVQMKMPFEDKASHYFMDASKPDTIWEKEDYKKLLPQNFTHYYPIYQAFYAGMLGRTEIIAHGSTVNPAYYKDESYFPFTPTAGCLVTKENWSEETGKLQSSDQYKLVEVLRKSGGAKGYAIVVNLNDEQRPVEIKDILPFLEPKF